MNLLDPMLGAIAAPDDATPEEINAALTPIRQQAERRQMMMQGLGALGRTVATAFSPVQEYPQVSPVAAMAMGPNYQSFREGQIAAIDRRQQAAQFEQRNALAEQQLQQQQRMQTQQLLQREKDSANQLRLQKMQHDNRLEAQRQRDQAIQERADAAARAKAEADAAKARQPRIDMRSGQQFHVDPETGQVIASPIQGYTAPPQSVRGGGGRGGGGRGGANPSIGGNTITTPDGQVWTENGGYIPGNGRTYVNRDRTQVLGERDLIGMTGQAESEQQKHTKEREAYRQNILQKISPDELPYIDVNYIMESWDELNPMPRLPETLQLESQFGYRSFTDQGKITAVSPTGEAYEFDSDEEYKAFIQNQADSHWRRYAP